MEFVPYESAITPLSCHAESGKEPGFTQDMSLVHHRANAHTGLALEMHARLSGRKLEQPEEQEQCQITQKVNSSSKHFLMPDICI